MSAAPEREDVSAPETIDRPRRNFLILLPLVVIGAVASLFFVMLGRGKSFLPSALIGKTIPDFALPGLPGKPALSSADLKAGKISIVNFFASWCVDCHIEHPYLVALSKDPMLARDNIQLVGVAQRDEPENTRRFLGADGDPYSAVGLDSAGRTSIDFGVYGIPETFLVDPDGKIVAKHIGALSAQTFEQKFAPVIAKIRGRAS